MIKFKVSDFNKINNLSRFVEENSKECFSNLLTEFLQYVKTRRGKDENANMSNCWTNYDMDSRVRDLLIDRFRNELEKIRNGTLMKNDFLAT